MNFKIAFDVSLFKGDRGTVTLLLLRGTFYNGNVTQRNTDCISCLLIFIHDKECNNILLVLSSTYV